MSHHYDKDYQRRDHLGERGIKSAGKDKLFDEFSETTCLEMQKQTNKQVKHRERKKETQEREKEEGQRSRARKYKTKETDTNTMKSTTRAKKNERNNKYRCTE